MGTTVSIHVLTEDAMAADGDTAAEEAMTACFAELREIDRVFSTYREDSDISRLRRGGSPLTRLDARVAEVVAACDDWERVTGGRFSARWRGWFDPTGYVKGWAVEGAARRHILPLVSRAGVVAAGVNAGGDLQLFTAPGADWSWRVGIADPARPGALFATVEVVDGAVATSGIAERGYHIVDPRTGEAARSILSATVVADGLAAADVWATVAVVSGIDDLSWIAGADSRTGLVIGAGGTIRRWVDAAEVRFGAASADPAAVIAF